MRCARPPRSPWQREHMDFRPFQEQLRGLRLGSQPPAADQPRAPRYRPQTHSLSGERRRGDKDSLVGPLPSERTVERLNIRTADGVLPALRSARSEQRRNSALARRTPCSCVPSRRSVQGTPPADTTPLNGQDGNEPHHDRNGNGYERGRNEQPQKAIPEGAQRSIGFQHRWFAAGAPSDKVELIVVDEAGRMVQRPGEH
jgi:hypothetical protein